MKYLLAFTDRPSILSSFDKPTQALIIMVLFALFAYVWYAFHLTMARSKRTNFHTVDRATRRRLDAQARGEDPEPLEDSAPVSKRQAREVTE
jgi:hypothetical protein